LPNDDEPPNRPYEGNGALVVAESDVDDEAEDVAAPDVIDGIDRLRCKVGEKPGGGAEEEDDDNDVDTDDDVAVSLYGRNDGDGLGDGNGDTPPDSVPLPVVAPLPALGNGTDAERVNGAEVNNGDCSPINVGDGGINGGNVDDDESPRVTLPGVGNGGNGGIFTPTGNGTPPGGAPAKRSVNDKSSCYTT
jgi:hypothetical protein